MRSSITILVFTSVTTCKVASQALSGVVSGANLNTNQPLEGFVSFSIEFSSFPDFAGNTSNPNEFSNNLLDNLGNLTGTKPYIRVGGNTQDYAIYNADLPIALNGTFNLSRSADYPTTIEIGPSFFESYTTWPNVKYSHGFNMGGNNDSRQWQTLLDTVPLACKALGKDRAYGWEYGNEPDLFATSSQGPVRPSSYNESDFVAEWLNGTRTIKALIEENCPDMAGNDTYGYLAPSFAGTNNHLKAPLALADGMDADQDIRFFSSHNYISGASTPGVTLSNTLLNHSRTMSSVAPHLSEHAAIVASSPPSSVPPLILGEANSLYNEGKPGLSDAFGAALWVLDFNLYCAAAGVSRVHMHLGTDYRYAAWQPVDTGRYPAATKPPYYGSVAVAAFLGDAAAAARVANLPLADGAREAAYAAYVDGALARLMVVNLRPYNYSMNGTGVGLNEEPRPVRTYSFDVGLGNGTGALVRRLVANGSDAVAGITWDGVSYDYELAMGKPVRLGNVTVGERVNVSDGVVEVGVADSQAVMLDFGAV
ncbi:glycoside hydrolase family 79 protein [Xylariaceae sp. FL0016]|nr:glycoside hydrolase family 79 protein [Xylariaceae sp. FL0016]